MAYFDPMELASPFNSAPCTPKPKSRNPTAPSPPYESNATVISLDSSPERDYTSYGIEDQMYDYLSRQEHQYNNGHDSDATQIPDFTEYGKSYQSPARPSRANITPLKLARARTYARHRSGREDLIPQILDHMVTSPAASKPRITVLLVLTPQPASLAETTAFEDLGSRFCKDFNKSEWSCISLYAHFRKWAAQESDLQSALGGHDASDEDVGIGSIHPYTLRAKLEQEKEVQWRLAVPVLQALIDHEVKRGSRAFVVCGMSTGDIEGVRAFGRTVSISPLCMRTSRATSILTKTPV
jgi:hypothetical protein